MGLLILRRRRQRVLAIDAKKTDRSVPEASLASSSRLMALVCVIAMCGGSIGANSIVQLVGSSPNGGQWTRRSKFSHSGLAVPITDAGREAIVFDVTVPDTLRSLHIALAAREFTADADVVNRVEVVDARTPRSGAPLAFPSIVVDVIVDCSASDVCASASASASESAKEKTCMPIVGQFGGCTSGSGMNDMGDGGGNSNVNSPGTGAEATPAVPGATPGAPGPPGPPPGDIVTVLPTKGERDTTVTRPPMPGGLLAT